MKLLKFFLAALYLMMLVSCSKDVQEVRSEELVPVTVRVNGFVTTQEDFPTTRGTAVGSYNDIKAMTLAFYKSDGVEAYKYTQFKANSSTFTTFGEFSLSLPVGSYTMVVLGYGQGSVAQEITLTSPTVATFGEGRVRETIAATQAVTISSGSSLSLTASLDRVVSGLAVVSTDLRPANAVSVRMTFSAGGTGFNPTTGFATTNTGFTNTVTLSNSVGTVSNAGSCLFLASDEQSMNVTIETLDADGQVLLSQTVNDVPLKRNRFTKLTGAIFTLGASAGSFEITNNWLDEYVVAF